MLPGVLLPQAASKSRLIKLAPTAAVCFKKVRRLSGRDKKDRFLSRVAIRISLLTVCVGPTSPLMSVQPGVLRAHRKENPKVTFALFTKTTACKAPPYPGPL